MLLETTYILVALTHTCCGIGIDYLMAATDEEEPENVTTTTEGDSLRVGGLYRYRPTTTTTTTTTTPTEEVYVDDEEEDDVEINIPTRTTKNKTTPTTTKQIRNITSKKTTTRNHNPTAFLEYEYYPEEEYYVETDTEKSELRRGNTESTTATMPTRSYQYRLRGEIHNNTNETEDDDVFDLSSNYEPAAFYQFHREFVPITRNYNTWYVPEKYPCWDLPILYGQLGRKKIVDKVFVISAATLKVVIDRDDTKIPISSFYQLEYNKWCTSAPCYGDHTLCMFSPIYNSKICDKSYQVEVPSIAEQISLVNTINSMRNHVAKGTRNHYPYLPSAMNMKQMLYDYDLERMAEAWLRQCLPGPAPCSSLDENYVTQLECTKFAEKCCIKPVAFSKQNTEESNCTPKAECFIPALTGCIYTWFWSAGPQITDIDIKCGHLRPQSYATTQLIWANTYKVGCAYGIRSTGDIRVACNFNPGAPFQLKTKYYCGVLSHRDVTHLVNVSDLMNDTFLLALGINLNTLPVKGPKRINLNKTEGLNQTKYVKVTKKWGVLSLAKNYNEGWARNQTHNEANGTLGLCARLVTRYKFKEGKRQRCDSDEPVYAIGPPGADCMETGRKFFALCYEFRDPTPGYRAMAVVAPVALFSLILYDLFSGVMRHMNN